MFLRGGIGSRSAVVCVNFFRYACSCAAGMAAVVLLFGAAPLWAANSGGMAYTIYDPNPRSNSYVGTKDNSTPLTTGADVFVDQDVAGSVVGGYSGEGAPNNADVTANTVTIGTRGGANTFTVGNSIQGGYSSTSRDDDRPTGNANNNRVIIYGGMIEGLTVSGGESTSYGHPSGNANNNTVTIYDGEMHKVYGGRTGSTSAAAGNANYNTITVYGGSMKELIGGRSGTSDGVAGSASYNTVRVYDGTIRDFIYGGYSHASGATSGEASHNTVSIYGGTIERTVYGGGSEAGRGGFSGNADYNTVNIYGGVFEKDIYGGYSHGGDTSGNATYNTVNIYGGTFDSTSTVLYGGWGTDNRTGNTLNIYTSGVSVNNIVNFQYYNFALSPLHGATLLTLDDVPSFVYGDRVKVMQINDGQRLNVGHSNILLHSTAGSRSLEDLTPDMLPAGQVRQGVSLLYDYTLAKNTNDDTLTATITGVQAAPQGKALSEGRAAALGFTLLGADLVAGAGMDNVRTVTSGKGLSGGSAGGMGLMPFFALSASSMRYNSGSHTDVSGMALMAGLAKKWEVPSADVLLGAFFEVGFGSYKAHNSFATGSVDGKGNTRSTGGGILARVDMTDTALKGLYAEASFRAGSLTSNYQSGDLRDFAGNTASYDMNSTYYGAHAGLGYIWNFTDKASLDLYAKYFWTHQTGQDVTILGDKFSFKDMDSQRIRLGGHFSYAVNEYITPYAGAAWEHEFDGKARATTYGLDVPAPSLKGSTGVGELGISWKPAANSGFSVDLGVQGYVGMRQGISGSLQLKFKF